MIPPPEAHDLVQVLGLHFTNPTSQRFSALLVGALVTTGRRTVANLLRTLRHLAPGHPTDYRRVLSWAPWSGLAWGCALMRFVLDHVVPGGPVMRVGDDTVDGHKGPHVYGKARHRDAVRSSHSYTAFRYGHKWVVLAVLVKFPFATRPWALPVLIDRYRSREDDTARNRPHRTPARILCGLLRVRLIRFPDRTFVFAGDSGCSTHEVARFCDRHRQRLTLVSKRHPDANLFDPPPPYTGKGRPRRKDQRRPKPRQAVATAKTFDRPEVGWYGGGTRRVETLEGTGHWYKAGEKLVLIRWVFVRDTTGTHRDEYFFTTDTNLTPPAVIGYDCGRWNIETTFQEMRAERGLETTRGWRQKTVRRAARCLFGLYSVVAILFHALPGAKRTGAVEWPGKTVPRSRTRWPPCAGGSGTKPFCHRPEMTRQSINSPHACGSCGSPHSPRPLETAQNRHQSSSRRKRLLRVGPAATSHHTNSQPAPWPKPKQLDCPSNRQHPKGSGRSKRLKAGWSDEYLLQILQVFEGDVVRRP